MSATILFFVILFVYLFLWIGINYIRLHAIHSGAKDSFSALDKFVRQEIFPLVESDLAKKHVQWYMDTDDPNRKLALLKAISDSVSGCGEYEVIKENFSSIIDKYNKYAKSLRHVTEVFPTSFMARLQEIKSVNQYN